MPWGDMQGLLVHSFIPARALTETLRLSVSSVRARTRTFGEIRLWHRYARNAGFFYRDSVKDYVFLAYLYDRVEEIFRRIEITVEVK